MARIIFSALALALALGCGTAATTAQMPNKVAPPAPVAQAEQVETKIGLGHQPATGSLDLTVTSTDDDFGVGLPGDPPVQADPKPGRKCRLGRR